MRATVRYRLDPPPPPGEPTLTDAVGEVLVNSDDEIVVETRRGVVRIPRDLVVATRIIPPKPQRRGVVGGSLAPLELHRAVADGWPAMTTDSLGDWLLRASRGFTGRANSVLPVGDPGLPLIPALDAVEAWYAARHLPANLTIAGPVGFDPAADPVGAAVLARGYVVSDPSLFLTADAAEVSRELSDAATQTVAAVGDSVSVEIGDELTEVWLTAYGGYRSGDREEIHAVMTGSPAQRFATARADGTVVGVGRLGVSGDWAGIAAMWVDPEYRRRGLARAMMRELASAAPDLGASRLHLQVWAHNAPALALYERIGFRRHHAYVNAVTSG